MKNKQLRAIEAYFKYEPIIPAVMLQLVDPQGVDATSKQDKIKIIQLAMNSWPFIMLAKAIDCPVFDLISFLLIHKINLNEDEAKKLVSEAENIYDKKSEDNLVVYYEY